MAVVRMRRFAVIDGVRRTVKSLLNPEPLPDQAVTISRMKTAVALDLDQVRELVEDLKLTHAVARRVDGMGQDTVVSLVRLGKHE